MGRNPVYSVLPFHGAAIIIIRFTPFQFSKVLKILLITILLNAGFEIFVDSPVKKGQGVHQVIGRRKLISNIFNILLILQPLKVSVAQLVEQLTLNQRVQGSNPCGDTDNQRIMGYLLLVLDSK